MCTTEISLNKQKTIGGTPLFLFISSRNRNHCFICTKFHFVVFLCHHMSDGAKNFGKMEIKCPKSLKKTISALQGRRRYYQIKMFMVNLEFFLLILLGTCTPWFTSCSGNAAGKFILNDKHNISDNKISS